MYGSNNDIRSNRGKTERNTDEKDDTIIRSSTKRVIPDGNYNRSQHAPLLGKQRSFGYDEQKELYEGPGNGYGSVSPGSMKPPSPMGGNSHSPMHGYRSMPPSFMHSQPPPPNLQQHFYPHQVPNAPPVPQYYMTSPYQNMWQQQQHQHQHQQQNMPPPPPAFKPQQQYSVESSSRSSSRQPLVYDDTLDYSDDDENSFIVKASSFTAPPPIKVVSAETATTATMSNNTVGVTRDEYNQSRQSSLQQARRKKPILKALSFNEAPLGDTPPLNLPKPKHRRNNSDLGYQQKRNDSSSSIPKPTHRRNHSAEIRSPLPLHPFHRKSSPKPSINRHRSHSYGGPPRHKRGDSMSSIASMSSILSDRSIVSDISRSVLFKDVTKAGKVQFHAPIDSIRLVMNEDLVRGELYRVIVAEDEEDRFISYTMQGDDDFSDIFPNEDSGGKTMDTLLYPTRYVLKVNDDLYQRVLKEISDSTQPCGFFFCGHHEDVNRPSILIAVVIIGIIFAALFVFTFIFP